MRHENLSVNVLELGSISSDGVLTRANLAEEALAVIGIPLHTLREADYDSLGHAESSGNHYISDSGNVVSLKGTVTDGNAKTDVSKFQFRLPENYVAGGDVKVRIRLKHVGAGTPTPASCTVAVNAYEQSALAVGSDLCATSAQTFTGTIGTKDFVITPTNLVVGSILNIILTTVATASAGAITAQIDQVSMLLDIKG